MLSGQCVGGGDVLLHEAVPAGLQGLGAVTAGTDPAGCARPPCSVTVCTQTPSQEIVAGADFLAGASHPAEKPGA